MENDKSTESPESSTSTFKPKELRALEKGQLAVLDLVVQALVETHPNPAELFKAFAGKAAAARTLMPGFASLHQHPAERRNYQPSAFQELIDDDLNVWLDLLSRQFPSIHHSNSR